MGSYDPDSGMEYDQGVAFKSGFISQALFETGKWLDTLPELIAASHELASSVQQPLVPLPVDTYPTTVDALANDICGWVSSITKGRLKYEYLDEGCERVAKGLVQPTQPEVGEGARPSKVARTEKGKEKEKEKGAGGATSLAEYPELVMGVEAMARFYLPPWRLKTVPPPATQVRFWGGQGEKEVPSTPTSLAL